MRLLFSLALIAAALPTFAADPPKHPGYRVLAQDAGRGTCKLERTDLLEMNPQQPCAVDPLEPVHKVFNPREFKERAVSLHVYSRPYDSCVVYSEEQGTCGEIKLSFNTEYGKRRR